ncbi:MAG: pyridoxal 5'-phosphate synthase glutaminase subunit PdxT [Bullifex sp.]|nr:pyridoxal 5'-phosphate synthase glutaminase subunit PdxT [Spirochaetales bacterium]MDY5777245.1 pyridoxal 5'-phosphate synthase glutaminase subunit PdxT [Bullifex sp.]
MRIGVLAVQGAFEEHIDVLRRLGAETVELRQQHDIRDLDGLVLPGGESTVQGKIIRETGMFEPLYELISGGVPVLATCAGLILLSEKLSNDGNVWFGTLPVTVKRNAYGRQLGSFETVGDVGDIRKFPEVFIRAPYIESVGEGVTVLSSFEDHVTGVRFGKQIGLSFHPELTADTRVHEYFLSLI